ncbi:hypothetical protein SNE40_008939 [Patella caerulea]|uniref:Nuclear nucleic acid-binding protein C1D n=1 Tax=Patella caerulea TaxID=87958 RepID=A0AAN8PWZ9_PATCE
MANNTGNTEIPTELKGKLAALDTSLTGLESSLEPLLKTSLSEMSSKLEPLDCAKMDLVAAYAINSLFWVYLNVNGINPKEHPIKQELDRIRGYMSRVKEIQDKAKAPKLDKEASKRFVKSALWQAALKKALPEQEKQIGTKASTSQSKTDNSKSQIWKNAHKNSNAKGKGANTGSTQGQKRHMESNCNSKKKAKRNT